MSRRVVVTCCREVIVVEKSCGDGLQRSVVKKCWSVAEKCCEEVLWRSVAEKCCEGVLWRSVVEKCCQEVLWRSLCGATHGELCKSFVLHFIRKELLETNHQVCLSLVLLAHHSGFSILHHAVARVHDAVGNGRGKEEHDFQFPRGNHHI